MDRYGIHPDTPIVWASDWDHWRKEGWRFECNLDISCHSANSMARYHIRGVQRRYGDENVALGHPMSDTGPFVSDTQIGVYTRDYNNVEILVIELYRGLDAWGR